MRSARLLPLLVLLAGAGAVPAGTAAAAAAPLAVPAWLFPGEGDLPQPPYDTVTPLHLPDSRVSYTEAQLFDQFAVPDWHPRSHPPLPAVVARGVPPEVYACGYCHLANGRGRPENASLAGLPQAYMLQQLADFKSGARRIAWPHPNPPSDAMIQVASHVSGTDAAAAVAYFSGLTLTQRSRVIEGDSVPAFKASGWTYLPVAGAPRQSLGERLLEIAPDALRDARRDDEMQYDAYVPAGSIERGRRLATGAVAGVSACVNCHGATLRGMAIFPPIAGRSASYLLRQLYAFKTGTRHSATDLTMAPVVAPLTRADMIAVCAYAASLAP
jgi:cytochrome c553